MRPMCTRAMHARIVGSACNNVGYVIFLRKSAGADLKRFNFIAKNIHLPFVLDKCRSEQFPECPTVCYCDGDTSQLKCVTDTHMQTYADNNITFNKHNASNTAASKALISVMYSLPLKMSTTRSQSKIYLRTIAL